MNTTNEVHDTLLYAALGALIGLIYGVGIYGATGLWGIALCVGGGLILGAVSGFISEVETQEGEHSGER